MTIEKLGSFIALVGIFSCGDVGGAPEEPVEISFFVAEGETEWACGVRLSLGTEPSDFEIEDLRFYVHDVALLTSEGDEVMLAIANDRTWAGGGITLLDFEDGTGPCDSGNPGLNRSVIGTVPPGEYVGLSFVLGVPFFENHQDASVAEAPLSYSSMFWGWQGGYKFLRLDGTTAAGNGNRIHLGSTGCEGSLSNITGCASAHRATIVLGEFDAASNRVVFDLNALFENYDLEANSENTPNGCMSTPDDPDCDSLFDALGLGNSPQTAFGVR